jgi:hypothetical protein
MGPLYRTCLNFFPAERVQICIDLLSVSFNLQAQQFGSLCLPQGTSDCVVLLHMIRVREITARLGWWLATIS